MEIKPAKTAPMPSVTSNAGRAQQRSVPILVNKLSIEKKACLVELFNTMNTFNTISRLCY